MKRIFFIPLLIFRLLYYAGKMAYYFDYAGLVKKITRSGDPQVKYTWNKPKPIRTDGKEN